MLLLSCPRTPNFTLNTKDFLLYVFLKVSHISLSYLEPRSPVDWFLYKTRWDVDPGTIFPLLPLSAAPTPCVAPETQWELCGKLALARGQSQCRRRFWDWNTDTFRNERRCADWIQWTLGTSDPLSSVESPGLSGCPQHTSWGFSFPMFSEAFSAPKALTHTE